MVVLTREETTYRPALWTRQHDSLAMRVRNFNQATTIDHGSFFFANNRCGVCIGSVDVFRRLNFNILRILLRLENFKKQNNDSTLKIYIVTFLYVLKNKKLLLILNAT